MVGPPAWPWRPLWPLPAGEERNGKHWREGKTWKELKSKTRNMGVKFKNKTRSENKKKNGILTVQGSGVQKIY